MGSTPKPQAPSIPAKKPDRNPGVAPEDVVLGGADNLDAAPIKGKRALIKPTGFISGLNVGG